MADRILGMGDVVSFVERAQEQFDEESTKRHVAQENQFDFNDFRDQIGQIKKMGGVRYCWYDFRMKKAMKGSYG